MFQFLLSPADQGIVVFRVWPGLPYGMRALIAGVLVVAGLIWQAATAALFPGILLVLGGNLLLLVCGYNNKVEFGKFKATNEWRRTTVEKLREIQKLDLKMKRWDRSVLDITNRSGVLAFVLLIVGMAVLFILGLLISEPALYLVAANAGVLLLPHWITGIRSILTRPRLMLKADALLKLLKSAEAETAEDKLGLFLLLEGKENVEVPSDVRFQYVPKGADPGFRGLQGQMAVNEVQGSSYLYFYVVAVAKEGYGLAARLAGWKPPEGLVLEPSVSGEVEVLVLRQATTKNSGYSTDEPQMRSILQHGIALARRVGVVE